MVIDRQYINLLVMRCKGVLQAAAMKRQLQ